MSRSTRWMVVMLVMVVTVGWGDVASAQGEQAFKVVVNAKNPVESATRAQVSDLFLKKTKNWSTGVEVEPIDLYPTSEVREAFSKRVHDRTVAAVKSFWQRQIFSGEAVPPPEIENEQQVIAWVGSSPGAIGYVSSAQPMAGDVKVLRVTD